jgi:(S)-mandelate dehydrogenase
MYPLERLAEEVGGELWFQLYNFRHRSITDRLVERAREAGYRALVVTTDCAVVGKRERDLRHGMLRHQLHLGSRLAVAFYPRWALTVLTSRPEFVNLAPELPPGRAAAPYISSEMDPSFDWDDLQRLRQAWPGAMFLKGVLRADDAARAVSFGLDGIVLSNHGGRQLECAIPALEVLSEVVDAVGAHATVLVDGGVRRGGDIAKAVALGASGVLLGRAPLYGLAAAGEAGVAKALEILRDEFDRTLALNGCTSVAGLTRELLRSR